jgi:hypothetical protein
VKILHRGAPEIDSPVFPENESRRQIFRHHKGHAAKKSLFPLQSIAFALRDFANHPAFNKLLSKRHYFAFLRLSLQSHAAQKLNYPRAIENSIYTNQ